MTKEILGLSVVLQGGRQHLQAETRPEPQGPGRKPGAIGASRAASYGHALSARPVPPPASRCPPLP